MGKISGVNHLFISVSGLLQGRLLTLVLEALIIANLIGGGIYLWRRFRNNP